MAPLFMKAREIAATGLGWEDVWARLRDKGLTRYEAKVAVFGKRTASRMEGREHGATRRTHEKEIA